MFLHFDFRDLENVAQVLPHADAGNNNVLASVASYVTEIRAERIAAGRAAKQAAKQARIDAIVRAGGTPPPVNRRGRPKGIPRR